MKVHPLKAYREASKMTLSQLAEKFGVQRAAVCKWERRGVPPSRLPEVERVTGIPIQELRPDLWQINNNKEQIAS